MVTNTVSKKYQIQRETLDQILGIQWDRELVPHGIVDNAISVEVKKGGDAMNQTTPMDQYVDQNESRLQCNWFIPIGLYESESDFQKRNDAVRKMTKDIHPKKLYSIIQEYLVPMFGCTCYQHWLKQFVYPKVPARATDIEIGYAIVGEMIDIGWDPMGMWDCKPPKPTNREIEQVVNYFYRKVDGMCDQEFMNELMQLFRTGSCRIKLLLHRFDDVIGEVVNQLDRKWLRRQMVCDHVEWLIRNDDRVYVWYCQQAFRKMNHNTAMSMPINDPSTSYQERIDRDLMLVTKPVRGEDEFSNQGHNQLRKNIMEETIPPYDYLDQREAIFDRYLSDNPYMSQYEDGYNLADAIRDILNDPAKRKEFMELYNRYGSRGSQYNNDIQTDVIDIAMKGAKTMEKKSTVYTPEEQELLRKLMSRGVESEVEPLDLSDATLEQIADASAKYLTKNGKDLLTKQINRWDKESEQDYSADEKAERMRDRTLYIANMIEDIVNSQDPNYVVNGAGEPGCYQEDEEEPEDPVEVYRNFLLHADNVTLVKYLMEKTSEKGYHRIKEMVMNGSHLDEVREKVCANLSDYMYEETILRGPDSSDEEYDPILQNFVMDLYAEIRNNGISWIQNFIDTYLEDEDAAMIYTMIRNRTPLIEVQRKLFELLVLEYDINYLRENLVDDPEPVFSTNVDLQLAEYLLNNDVVGDEDDDDEEDEDASAIQMFNRDKEITVTKIMPRYPNVDYNTALHIHIFMETLTDDDMTVTSIKKMIVLLLERNDAENILRMKDDVTDAKTIDNLAWALMDTLVARYDLDELFQMFGNNDVPVTKVPLKNPVETKVTPESSRKEETVIDVEPREITRNRDMTREQQEHDEMMRRILGDNYDSDVEEEEDSSFTNLTFFGNDTPSAPEARHEYIDTGDDAADLRSLIQSVVEYKSDPLDEKKDEFFDWMMKTIPGVDPDELDKQLEKLSENQFISFANNVVQGIKSGKIKTNEDNSDLPDLGRHTDLVRRMRGAKVSSTEEENDENLSDKEVERRLRKLLYST